MLATNPNSLVVGDVSADDDNRADFGERRAERGARNHGALPAHLPRYEVVIDVAPEACPCCGGTMHSIGELRTEQLDIVPAQLLAAYLAVEKGLDPDRPRTLTKITRTL